MPIRSVRRSGLPEQYYAMEFPGGVYDVSRIRVRGEWSFPAHHQDGIEMILTTGVHGTALVGGHTYAVESDCIICVGPKTVHSYRFRGTSGSVVVLSLDMSFLSSTVEALGRGNGSWLGERIRRTPVLTGADAQRARQAIGRLSKYRTNVLGQPRESRRGPGAVDDLRQIFRILSIMFGRTGTVVSESITTNPRVRTIIDVIQRNADCPVSLDEIAGACAMTKFHLCRVFRKHTGTTIVDYLTRIRIDRAKRLLVDGEMKASEVAEQCGFSSLSYFIRVFARYEKITPKQWVLGRRRRTGGQ